MYEWRLTNYHCTLTGHLCVRNSALPELSRMNESKNEKKIKNKVWVKLFKSKLLGATAFALL